MTREQARREIDSLDFYLQNHTDDYGGESHTAMMMAIKALEQEPKTGHCKNCKYFEYDSVAKVDGIPLIVAHEICSKWGDGCKTKEDGYCFLFEPQESEVEE